MLVILRFIDNSSSLDKELFVKASIDFFWTHKRYRKFLNVEGDIFLKKLLQELNNCTYINATDKNRIKEKYKPWLEKR